MSMRKKYLKNQNECTITFTIPKSIGDKYKKISVVGEFNDWDQNAHQFKKTNSKGTYSVSVRVPVGGEYQFRYVADGIHWFNEEKADKQIAVPFGDSENSVVKI
ncbi:hypothetical protein MNBD_IGNAVI01-2612 [hydrothermal vent metagenome]|uniref:Glycoside hydrolase family 13 N-terminal domain-containing protein n=1 Tax=hydrothermal vent metagenome TaxID=652676 RepID=A0A3B1C7T9_9ZZZZ